jgi:succinate dehydrogenase/fumarate reductase cytochrome b subunit
MTKINDTRVSILGIYLATIFILTKLSFSYPKINSFLLPSHIKPDTILERFLFYTLIISTQGIMILILTGLLCFVLYDALKGIWRFFTDSNED